MKIFVISLKSAQSRRAHVQRQFAYLGLDFEFFDAIAADEQPQKHFRAVDLDTFRLNTYRSPLGTEMGCFASHRALWNYATTINEPIVILEDDAQLSDSFASAVETTRDLIEHFGFIRLEPYKRERAIRIGRQTHDLLDRDGYGLYYVSKVPVCLLAYAVSPAASAKLIRASATFDSPVDKFVQRTWEHRVPVFGLKPAPVLPSKHARQSTIGPREQKTKCLPTMFRRSCYKFLGETRRMRFDKHELSRFTDSGSVTGMPVSALRRSLGVNQT